MIDIYIYLSKRKTDGAPQKIWFSVNVLVIKANQLYERQELKCELLQPFV